MSEAEYLETSSPAADGKEPATSPAPGEALTDGLAGDAAGAEAGKTEQAKPSVRERYRALYYAYKADGRLFKIGIALVTAVSAACVIIISGIVSQRRLGVVFLRAVVGFFVSGAAMGGALYWLDRFGIPLFIAKHGDQLQMEWLSEAEEPEEELFAAEVLGGVPNAEVVKLMEKDGYKDWYTLENPIGDDYLADVARQVAVVRLWCRDAQK